MSGLYEAPKHWAIKMVAPSEHDQSSLLQLLVAAAVAFSIVTEGPGGPQGPPKIRRGEDWRRSRHSG